MRLSVSRYLVVAQSATQALGTKVPSLPTHKNPHKNYCFADMTPAPPVGFNVTFLCNENKVYINKTINLKTYFWKGILSDLNVSGVQS